MIGGFKFQNKWSSLSLDYRACLLELENFVMPVLSLLQRLNTPPGVMHLEFDGQPYQKTCSHVFAPPAPADVVTQELLALCVPLDALAQWQALYAVTNGVLLFSSPGNNVDMGEYFIPPIQLHPYERLAAETAYMHAQVCESANTGDEEPPWSRGLVMGEAVGTGNPLVLLRWGERAGQILYADHDSAGEPGAVGWASLTDLLASLAEPPHTAISQLCGADRVWF